MKDLNKKILPPEVFLKVHHNPFIVDKTSEYKKRLNKMVGQEDLMQDAFEEICSMLEDRSNGSVTISVQGESGSGKTLFAKCLIHMLRKNEESIDLEKTYIHEPLAILTSAINAESQMYFLSIWRPIL